MVNLNSASAANIDAVNSDGDISVLRCGADGVLGFESFLDAVLWNDKLDQGVMEPIADIFERNQCHSNDVIGLIKQQDQIRSQIRRAFLTCNSQEIERLRVAYHKLSAEIYYVRNIVNGELALSLPFQILNSGNSERVEKSRDDLYEEMAARYGQESFFGIEALNNLFLSLEVKYKDRKKTYINCDTGSWEKVAERWNDFKNNFSDQYGDLQTAYGRTKGAAKSLSDQVSTIELFSGDQSSFGEYVGSFISSQINGIEPEKGIEEIANKLGEQIPEFESTPLSHSDLINELSFEGQRYDVDKIEAEMKGFFDVRYGTGSESTAVFINQLDGRDSQEVVGLLESLDRGISEISRLDSGLNDVNLRQCVAN